MDPIRQGLGGLGTPSMLEDLQLLGFLFGIAIGTYAGALLTLAESGVMLFGFWAMAPQPSGDRLNTGNRPFPWGSAR